MPFCRPIPYPVIPTTYRQENLDIRYNLRERRFSPSVAPRRINRTGGGNTEMMSLTSEKPSPLF